MEDDENNNCGTEKIGQGEVANDTIKGKTRSVSHTSAAINRLEKDIEVWRKRYKEKMKENLRLKKKVVQVQRNAESFFWHKEDDKEELIRENTKLRETNLKLERNNSCSRGRKLRAAYSKETDQASSVKQETLFRQSSG